VTYNVPYRKLLTGRTKQEDIEEDPYVPVLALSNVSAKKRRKLPWQHLDSMDACISLCGLSRHHQGGNLFLLRSLAITRSNCGQEYTPIVKGGIM